jgi:hypothetical protein
MKSPKPYSIGRVVIYTPTEEDNNIAGGNRATALPATIVATWEHTSYENDEVNLKVLSDGFNDLWKTSVPYDEAGTPGTWKWPEIK